MTRLTAMKEISECDSSMLADATGIDIVTIHMVEQGRVPIHYDHADAMCQAMDVAMTEMFPSISEILTLADSLDSEAEIQELFFEPANRMAIRSAGLDPDLRDWIMIVDLRSANERRYRLSSMEVDKVKNALVSAKDANGYICFYSDCQQVILKKDAISEVAFTAGASYAQFSSRERAYAATMVFEGSARPEVVGLHPDPIDVDVDHPFAMLLHAAMNGQDLPPFFQVETDDDDEHRFVSVHGLEVLEIPMGVLFSEIYSQNSDARYVGMDSGLAGMDAQGEA
jgi:transcriptional regulator with XRE-family HTH domain